MIRRWGGGARLLSLSSALGVLACRPSDAGRCPGQPLAVLAFAATSGASDACGVAAGTAIPFTATLTVDPGGSAAWLCTEKRLSAPLQGTLEGDHLHASLVPEGAGAVIAACGSNCAASVTEIVDGTVIRSGGAVTGFDGTLEDDVAAATPGTCGACGDACAVTYTLVSPPP